MLSPYILGWELWYYLLNHPLHSPVILLKNILYGFFGFFFPFNLSSYLLSLDNMSYYVLGKFPFTDSKFVTWLTKDFVFHPPAKIHFNSDF